MHHTVLVVDDEEFVLRSLLRELRKEPYHLITAGSGQEALTLLREKPASVIISDMQMPEMNGVEFLARAREISPDSVNMILSGHSDIDLVMAAINSGAIWRYLTKPWQTEDLRVAINNAIEFYSSQSERKQLLEELRQKNEELSRWGQLLEQKVKEQTSELFNQSILLRQILEGRDFSTIWPMISTFVGELFKVRGIYVYDPASDVLHAGDPEAAPLANGWKDSVTKIMQSHDVASTDGSLYYPLLSEDTCQGVVIIPDTRVHLDEVREYFNGYASIAAIALNHHRLREDAPAMLDNIDNLLDNLQ